ncbi:hypothetical protein HIM_07411 [Hirsutella minnesotensis 3608]|uniref:LicD/FKTN/FKRP nucleotidyltransferase domain-containing protein n=1 Tax=Hirsutella minnesotensis 3608 TaxID=1043627 RepID=A0A0F8A4A0_9HYPO|nr:hypothetical protein HIM_07411 [Hirsutella minnesotensis 3608]
MKSRRAVASLLLLLFASAWGAAPKSPAGKRDLVPSDEDKYPEPKYFKEHLTDPHYDARFMVDPLDEETQHKTIRYLVMPWDFDADLQVAEADMFYLAAYHNMTVYYYKYGDMKTGRYFLLDINPHFKHREMDDVLNFIDARWIDLATGLFIDITAARYNVDHPAGVGVLYDKHGHEFRDTFLFPLRNTTFEGVPVMIPYRYQDMLESEYGKDALTNKTFHGHVFDEEATQWVIAP